MVPLGTLEDDAHQNPCSQQRRPKDKLNASLKETHLIVY
jgi:hypothetical protein